MQYMYVIYVCALPLYHHSGFVVTHVHDMPNYMSYHKPMGG